jgi:hypothetical protein
MKRNFNHIERIYWVFTQLCNDQCDHCYNNSGPHGTRMSEEECMAIIDNMPDQLDRISLSGGEPLAERKLLFKILDKLREKYGNKLYIALQFNGDLLTPKILKTLLEKGVDRFSIASIDRYHKKQGERKELLAGMFEEHGIVYIEGQPKLTKSDLENDRREYPTYGFFGATEDMWLGGNWARGRSMEHDIWKRDGLHNFCAIPSGAIAFLGNEAVDMTQEISIQLWAINPCCPGTKEPMGDARVEKVSEVMERMSKSEVMQILNSGDAWKMGLPIGITEDFARKRSQELENVCLWCDEFFTKYFDMKKQEAKAFRADNPAFIPEKMGSKVRIVRNE